MVNLSNNYTWYHDASIFVLKNYKNRAREWSNCCKNCPNNNIQRLILKYLSIIFIKDYTLFRDVQSYQSHQQTPPKNYLIIIQKLWSCFIHGASLLKYLI